MSVSRLARIPRPELPDPKEDAFAAALRRRLEADGIPTANVVLGLPAQSSILRYMMVPLAPPWRIDLLVHYEVEEIAERMGEVLCAGWRTENVGGGGSERPLLLALGKETEINQLLRSLSAAGIQVASAIPYAEALLCGWRSFCDSPPDEGVEVLVEVGARFTHVVITVDGELLFARQAAFGGRQFNEALAERISASPEEIEKLKRSSTGLVSRESRLDFSEVLRRPAGQLVNLIRGSITTAEAQLKTGKLTVRRVTLTGGAPRLRGMHRYVGQALGIPVVPFRISGDLAPPAREALNQAFPEGVGGFLPVLGLGATVPVTSSSGNAETGGVLEVLPQAVRSRREFWNEKVFMYGAAALLVAFLILQLVAGLSQSYQRRAHLARLEGQVRRLEGDSVEFAERRQRQDSLDSRRRALEAQVEAGAFYGKVLSFLGSELPDEIHLVALRQEKSKGGDAAPSLELEGLADNTNRTAVSLIDALDRSLSTRAFVGRVTLLTEYSRPEPERNAYRFRLKISGRREVVEKKNTGEQ